VRRRRRTPLVIDVDIVMRSDYKQTFGGDVVQVQRYLQHVPDDLDVMVHAAGPRVALRNGSVVHIVNIDREWDFLEVIRQARRHSVVVSSIHHSRSAVRGIKHLRERSVRTWMERGLPEPTFSLLTRIYRGRSWPSAGGVNPLAYVHGGTLRRLVGRALSSAAMVLVLAPGEQTTIEEDYSIHLDRVALIPHGLETTSALDHARDIPILVPGRIEPRKNQLAVLQALHRARQPSVFVGAPHPHGGAYVRRFSQLASASPWITWIKGAAPGEMPSWYGRSRVVLNLSLVEVLSLVDFEAHGSGCHLITTTAGHTRDWLGNAASYVDPLQVDSAVLLARAALRDWTPKPPSQQLLERLDWARAGADLTAVYRSVSG